MFAAKLTEEVLAAHDHAVVENKYRDRLLQIISEDKERLQFTPDHREILPKRSHLIFIHDDMMQLQPNHKLVHAGSLSGFYPMTYGYTSRRFTFVKKELGLKSFPIALDMRYKDDLPMFVADEHRIRGEVYAIRPQQLILLDTHRQNGVQFNRVKVNINIGSRKLRQWHWFDAHGRIHYERELEREEMITQEMFMYIGREDYWRDQLTTGFFDFKPIDIIQEDRLWLKKYYQYSRVR